MCEYHRLGAACVPGGTASISILHSNCVIHWTQLHVPGTSDGPCVVVFNHNPKTLSYCIPYTYPVHQTVSQVGQSSDPPKKESGPKTSESRRGVFFFLLLCLFYFLCFMRSPPDLLIREPGVTTAQFQGTSAFSAARDPWCCANLITGPLG